MWFKRNDTDIIQDLLLLSATMSIVIRTQKEFYSKEYCGSQQDTKYLYAKLSSST